MTRATDISRRALLSLGGVGALAACGAGGGYARRVEDRWPPEGGFVEAEGLRIHHVARGDPAAPPVVLIHGATGNLRDMSFRLLDRVAAEGFRAVAFDRPGLGYSERPGPGAEPWRPATQARILRKAAERLGLAQGAALIGHSWGGPVALAWAMQAPDAVAGVVTVCGANMPWGEEEGLLSAIADSAPAVALKGALARAVIGLDGGEDVAARIFAPQAPPDGYIAHVGGPLSLRPASFRANSEDLDRLDASLAEQAKGYPGLKPPVLALHGAADEIAWARVHADGLAAIAPAARARIFEGVGHMLHHALPDAVIKALRDVRQG